MCLLVQTTCLFCHVWKESNDCEHKKDVVTVAFKRKKLAEACSVFFLSQRAHISLGVFLLHWIPPHFPRFQHMFNLLTLE